MKESKRICKAWLSEASETKDYIPNDRQELFQHIDVLRQRLIKIASVYGYRSSEALIFSQYLDKFIVQYQKLK